MWDYNQKYFLWVFFVVVIVFLPIPEMFFAQPLLISLHVSLRDSELAYSG